jgi:hypothetical protein
MKQGTENYNEYFASVEDHEELASRMKEKIRVWREWARGAGLMNMWRKKISNYYGNSFGGNSSQGVTRGGSEGELAMIKVNDLHSLIQQQLVLVTSQRPAGIAKATNSDTKSLKASRIGSAIAEYYLTQKNFEGQFISACERALLCDEAFVLTDWDRSLGEPIMIDPMTGEVEMTGDVTLEVYSTWNAARDPGCPVTQQKWHILSKPMNRFELMAKYPKFADAIRVCKDDDLPNVEMNYLPPGSDMVYAHLLVHDQTPAVPNGRYALLVGDYIILDTELPFDDYPVDRISPSDVIDGVTGYSNANDVMALEEVTDALHSIITTNSVTLGGATIISPQGAGFNHTDLGKGLRMIELAPEMVDKLRVIELAKTASDVFGYIDKLGQKKDQAVGSNSVVRGQPEGELSGASGSALALIQAQAISFNSGVQKSYFNLLSSSMTKVVKRLQKFGDFEKIVSIVGKNKRRGAKEFKFTGEDIQGVSSIVFELVNPVSQTLGGRMALADTLMQHNQIKNPKQYITLVETGQLDALTEDDEMDQLLILEENEWLSEMKRPKAIITQNHSDHIRSHLSQISLEAAVSNPEFVANILSHVQEHIDLWQQASLNNPGILMATGQQPLMPPPPMGAPGMPPMPPQGPGTPDVEGPSQNAQMRLGNPTNPVVQAAQEVRQPNLPKIAGTQQEAQVPGFNAGV